MLISRCVLICGQGVGSKYKICENIYKNMVKWSSNCAIDSRRHYNEYVKMNIIIIRVMFSQHSRERLEKEILYSSHQGQQN